MRKRWKRKIRSKMKTKMRKPYGFWTPGRIEEAFYKLKKGLGRVPKVLIRRKGKRCAQRNVPGKLS